MSTVTLTIDGRTVTVPKGTTVYHAARQLGIEIPIFCYHDRMPPLGACRMCFVQVDRMPRLQTACTLEAQEGMVVWTESPEVVEARRAILEFLLINHPLDCPICDKGGECPLQDNTFRYGPGASRFVEPKRHFPKAVRLSPVLTLDRERCILCWRCTRFGEVVAGDHALKGHERGYRTHIDVPPVTQERPSKFIGNTIAICPVGALTSGVYRFRARPWDNQPTAGVCTHCGVGCATWVDTRGGEVVRVRAREKPEVNDIWLCDVGFFGYDYTQHPDRLTTPYMRQGGTLQPASWEEALDVVARALRQASPRVGALGGKRLTVEEAYLLGKLFRFLGSNHVDARADSAFAPPREWAWGAGPFEALDRVGVFVLVGCDLSEDYPVLWLRAKRALDRGAAGLALAPKRLEIAPYLQGAVVHRYGTEADVLYAAARLLAERSGSVPEPLRQVKVQTSCDRAGVSCQAVEDLVRHLARPGPVLFVVGQLSWDGPQPGRTLAALQTLRAVCGGEVWVLRGKGNATGALLAGLAPDALPGLVPPEDPQARARVRAVWGFEPPISPGLAAPAMLEAAAAGRLSVLYVAGADPARDFPDGDLWKRARAKLDLLVVTDLFWTTTVEQADVVLPALSCFERAGTWANLEGRLQRVAASRMGPPGARADGDILQLLSQRLGRPMEYASVDEVWEELRRVAPGMELDRPYSFPRPQPRVEVQLPTPLDGEGLVVVPSAPLFRTGEMASRCRGLPELAGNPTVVLHPEDAVPLGLEDGAEVELQVGDASARARATVDAAVAPGHVLVPVGFSQFPRSRWQRPGLRVRVRALQPAGRESR
ncbi:MAG: NADH dehydrogenase (quinone) subunit G [candidate division GAL15 bacterium]